MKEELDLDVIETHLIGNYIFERKNEIMLCYHVVATGTVKLNEELAEFKRYQPHELKPWPRATGFAVADWMRCARAGRRVRRAPAASRLPGAEPWNRRN